MGYRAGAGAACLARIDTAARSVVLLGAGGLGLAEALRLRMPRARLIGLGARCNEAGLDAHLAEAPDSAAGRAALDRALQGAPIGQLVVGAGLARLHDPAAALAALRRRMQAGGRVAACMPNAGHWARLRSGLAGADGTGSVGFGRAEAQRLFEAAGFSAETGIALPGKAASAATLDALVQAAKPMGVDPALARRNLTAGDWMLTFRAGPAPAERRVVAVGIRGAARSLSTIRLIQPLEALGGHRPLKSRVTLGDFVLPRPGGPPGILVTYRLHPLPDSDVAGRIARLAAEGWLILHDVDDHPAYLKAQRGNDFRSIRTAHAVTVTNPRLAEAVRPLNPHVHVVGNQILDLPAPPDRILAAPRGPLRAIFAAINREADWRAQCGTLEAALAAGALPVRLTAVHAPDLSKRLGSAVRPLPFLDYPDYRREMLAADVALCPLSANEFNACKSDLKIVESLAHGTVPIVSAVAAAGTDVPRDRMLVAETPDDWVRHLRALAEDPALLAGMKAAGLDWVTGHRMWHGHVAALDALHDRLLADLPRLQADRLARIAAWAGGA